MTEIETSLTYPSKVFASLPDVEFIIQRNEETEPLWRHLEPNPPANMSFLFDESKVRFKPTQLLRGLLSNSPIQSNVSTTSARSFVVRRDSGLRPPFGRRPLRTTRSLAMPAV